MGQLVGVVLMIKANLQMHLRFARRAGVTFKQWSFREDDGRWCVVKRSASSTAVYKVIEFDVVGLQWLQAHEEARSSYPLV